MDPDEYERLLAEGVDPIEILLMQQGGQPTGDEFDPYGWVPGDLEEDGTPQATDSYTVGRQGNIINRWADLMANPYLQMVLGQMTGLPTYDATAFLPEEEAQPEFVSAPTRFDSMLNSGDQRLVDIAVAVREGGYGEFEVNQLIDSTFTDMPLESVEALKREVATGFEQEDARNVAMAEFEGRQLNGYGGGEGGYGGGGGGFGSEQQAEGADLLARTNSINPFEQYTGDTIPLEDSMEQYLGSLYGQGDLPGAERELRGAEAALGRYQSDLDNDARGVMAEPRPTTPTVMLPGEETPSVASTLDWRDRGQWGAPQAPSIATPLDWNDESQWDAAGDPIGEFVRSMGIDGVTPLDTRSVNLDDPDGNEIPTFGVPAPTPPSGVGFGVESWNPALGQAPGSREDATSRFADLDSARREVQNRRERGRQYDPTAEVDADPIQRFVSSMFGGGEVERGPAPAWRGPNWSGGGERSERRSEDRQDYVRRPRGSSERDRERTMQGRVRRGRVQVNQERQRDGVLGEMDQSYREHQAWQAQRQGRTPAADQARARAAALMLMGYGR